MTSWTAEDAQSRWLEDLESDSASGEAARRRLAEAPLEAASARERSYREAAARWLDRGQGRVALALLERSCERPAAPTPDGSPRPGTVAADVDLLLARRPGEAGLPALTSAEAASLRAAASPEEALAVVRAARVRLESHGQEARRLLRRWLERKGHRAG